MRPYIHNVAEVSNNYLIILQEPRDVTTSVGTHISLCTVVYSQNPSFQWYDELGKPVANENEKDLFIGPVKKEDFGFYKLEIIDKVTGERKYTRWSEVKDLRNTPDNHDYSKPKLVFSPEGGKHKKGTDIHLFGAFDNAIEHQWYKDEEMLQGCRGNNLIISECVSENSGRYVLLARNFSGIERTEEVELVIC